MALTPMTMSRARMASAHASASDRNTVFRAGTYVDGMSFASSGRSLGTGAPVVSDDPPNSARLTSHSRCRSTSRCRATSRAASSSAAWRWPYPTVSAYSRNPCDFAIAAAVYESRPPLSSTTAASPPAADRSDTAGIRLPDVLVQLQLHTYRQRVGQNPLRQRPRMQHAMHRRQVNRCGASGEVVAGHHVAGILVIVAIAEDELDFVVRPQALEIGPVHASGFTAARALHVEDG